MVYTILKVKNKMKLQVYSVKNDTDRFHMGIVTDVVHIRKKIMVLLTKAVKRSTLRN